MGSTPHVRAAYYMDEGPLNGTVRSLETRLPSNTPLVTRFRIPGFSGKYEYDADDLKMVTVKHKRLLPFMKPLVSHKHMKVFRWHHEKPKQKGRK